MTYEEAKRVFLDRGYVEADGGTIYDPDAWRNACSKISKVLEQDMISREMARRIIDSGRSRDQLLESLNSAPDIILELDNRG